MSFALDFAVLFGAIIAIYLFSRSLRASSLALVVCYGLIIEIGPHSRIFPISLGRCDITVFISSLALFLRSVVVFATPTLRF